MVNKEAVVARLNAVAKCEDYKKVIWDRLRNLSPANFKAKNEEEICLLMESDGYTVPASVVALILGYFSKDNIYTVTSNDDGRAVVIVRKDSYRLPNRQGLIVYLDKLFDKNVIIWL